ncbi:MAG: GatB/YqeY domain-containing protein [Pseudomonadota bacterium]
MLREQLETELKQAMKARDDKVRLSTLRLIHAAVKDRDIAARGEDRCEGVTDEEILGILSKMVRQREESSSAYDAACRPELAEQERAEIEVIRTFMPRQLSEEETSDAISEVVSEISAAGLKDMGKVMAALKQRYNGSMDFSKANAIVKKALQ